jgi:hypothetical protein
VPTINWSEINWLAVLVAGFAAFMLAGAWYAALFGKPWQAAHGFSEEDVKKAQAQMNPVKFFGGMTVCYLLVSLGMAIVLQWTATQSLGGGAMVGGTVGVIIVAPIVFTNHMPSMVKLPGFLIDASCSVIYCTLIGAILGAWH